MRIGTISGAIASIAPIGFSALVMAAYFYVWNDVIKGRPPEILDFVWIACALISSVFSIAFIFSSLKSPIKLNWIGGGIATILCLLFLGFALLALRDEVANYLNGWDDAPRNITLILLATGFIIFSLTFVVRKGWNLLAIPRVSDVN